MDGVDLDLLKEIKEVQRGRVADYVDRPPRAAFVANGRIWDVPVEVALTRAPQNELIGEDAKSLLRGGVVAVVEGANMPTTADAVAQLQDSGVLFAPGKAANAMLALGVAQIRAPRSRARAAAPHIDRRVSQQILARSVLDADHLRT